MRAIAGLLSGFLAAQALAADYLAGPEDYRELLPRLQAGDRLVLRAGEYARGLPLHRLEGTPERPVVIEGQDGARFLARPGANTVSLLDVRHVTIRNLELDGRNLPVDAVKAEGHGRYAHFVTLERLRIHDHAASQQSVGISSKCPAFGWVVRGNVIERTGTGMYFGDSDGSDPFVAGLIEGNVVRDSVGYNLQIKHRKAHPADLPELDRDHDTVIRGNFFAKETAWPDRAARPNVLVGHAPLEGPGSGDRVLAYGNVFWQNPSEALFQGEGNLALYNNVFVNSSGHAVHIQPHNDVPREVTVFHNTVLARGHGIRILAKPEQPPTWPQRILRNVVFAAAPVSGGEARDNHAGGVDAAARFLRRPFAEPGELDLTPSRPLAGKTSPEELGLTAFPDAERDMNGLRRSAPSLGACASRSPCPARWP